jgi:hypothetical protein
MLKLLKFVERSDTAKKIKGENNDAIKSMDAAIKAQLPRAIKKTEKEKRTFVAGDSIGQKHADLRRKPFSRLEHKTRPSVIYSHYVPRSGPAGKVYTPPEHKTTEPMRASVVLGDDPEYRRIKEEAAAAEAKYNKAMAELDKSPLHDEIRAFLAAEGTRLMPNELVKQHINEMFAEAARKKKIDELTKKNQRKKIEATVRSWIQVRQAQKKIAEGKRANADKWKKLHEAVEKRNEERERDKLEKTALNIQRIYRGKRARERVTDMRAEDTVTALEAQVADEDEGEPDGEFVTRAAIDVAIDEWSNGDFRIEKTNDDGDCLFEAFAYQLRRGGRAELAYLEHHDDFPDEWPFIAKSDGKAGVNILRHILANAVTRRWYPEDFESAPGKNYMRFLARDVTDGNLYDSQEDYFKHMTSPNLETAKVALKRNYKPKGRFGDRPELSEFQRLFDTEIQIIVASMDRDNTTLKFNGSPPPLFQVIKDKIYDTESVLTLIFYVTPGNRGGEGVPAFHYEIIALTEKGKFKKDGVLVDALSTDADEGKSSTAVTTPSTNTDEGKSSAAATTPSTRAKKKLDDQILNLKKDIEEQTKQIREDQRRAKKLKDEGKTIKDDSGLRQILILITRRKKKIKSFQTQIANMEKAKKGLRGGKRKRKTKRKRRKKKKSTRKKRRKR